MDAWRAKGGRWELAKHSANVALGGRASRPRSQDIKTAGDIPNRRPYFPHWFDGGTRFIPDQFVSH
jgi:hypothetical protein